MEHPKYNEAIQRLARWVFEVLIYHDEKKECPAVGYLGYANGMDNAEWLVVCLAENILTKRGKRWQDYFDYNVDSSG